MKYFLFVLFLLSSPTLAHGEFELNEDQIRDANKATDTATAPDFMQQLFSIMTDPNNAVSQERTSYVLTSHDRRQIDCLARAIYFESRGEPKEGQLAVAHVIFNRVQQQHYGGNSVCSVVQKKTGNVCQFSWFCKQKLQINPSLYSNIQELAHDFYVNYESFIDITRGALYFHADYVRTAWSGVQRTIKIGRHIFYRPKEREKKSKY